MSVTQSIYLDYAATAPLAGQVWNAMEPFLKSEFGNPSSLHAPGRRARHAVEDSRERIATVLRCDPDDVIFTGGGTEANNMALFGTFAEPRYKNLVTADSEHEAIRQPAMALKEQGIDVRFAAPDPGGSVSAFAIGQAQNHEPALVSIMLVNNETGALNPIEEIADGVKKCGGVLHTDAVQGAGFYSMAEVLQYVDMMTLSGHKLGGPKGVGVLIVKGGHSVAPLILGGSQERKRRAGTENVPAIVGMAKALELAQSETGLLSSQCEELKLLLRSELATGLGEQVIFTTPERSAPHILHMIALDQEGAGVDGEMLILGLDLEGIYVSSGSACTSGALEPSHVLSAIGISPDIARGALRFSLGRSTSRGDILAAAKTTCNVAQRLGSRVHV